MNILNLPFLSECLSEKCHFMKFLPIHSVRLWDQWSRTFNDRGRFPNFERAFPKQVCRSAVLPRRAGRWLLLFHFAQSPHSDYAAFLRLLLAA